MDNELEKEYQELLQKYAIKKDCKKREILQEIEEQKELINSCKNRISVKEQELLNLDKVENLEVEAVDKKLSFEIEKEKTQLGKASEYLEDNDYIDIVSLQAQAEEVQRMQSYLREYDKMVDIRDGKLASWKEYSSTLTKKIEKARELPSELLKTAKMPINGISVDSKGMIRINGTLIDGLSDGEKLELSFVIAKAQCGELKLICLDRFESLNEKERKKLIEDMATDDYQYILTSTESDEYEIVQFNDKKEIINYFGGEE